jgi:hypothetical protein
METVLRCQSIVWEMSLEGNNTMLVCIDPSSTWRTEFNESIVCGTITEMFALLCRIRMFPEPEIHATETYIISKNVPHQKSLSLQNPREELRQEY